MTSHRLPGRGRVSHDAPMRFTFDGVAYEGLEGDSVASALLANGVHLVGRSFKYHRPRGILTAGAEEPNALIGVTRGAGRNEPNTRATMQELYDGLNAESQNRWPSLNVDIGVVNDGLHAFLPAGFYYKTFMWPRQFWDKVYEPAIRAAAGLGKAPKYEDPDNYASRYHYCDMLIVGAGPAGLSAAITTAKSGASVVLVDEQNEMGGSLLSAPATEIDGRPAWSWLEGRINELCALDNVRLMSRTTAIGYFHQNMVVLCQRLTDHLAEPPQNAPRERLWRVRAKHVVLAQGAIEKPLIFDGNDRPGVMLAGAAQTYANRYAVKIGDAAVVATSHDSAWHSAFDLVDAGARVTAIADTRNEISPDLLEQAASRKIETLTHHTILSTTGRRRIRSVRIAPIVGAGVGDARNIPCDALLMCGGWTPSLHLFSHTKGNLDWDDSAQTFTPGRATEACQIAGAGRNLWGVAAALDDGARAGAAAAQAVGLTVAAQTYHVRNDRIGAGVAQKELPAGKNAGKARAFVDFQNDVTAKDIRVAVHEGMRSIEHIKRYTTNGMATDQGKLSNINGLMIAADAVGKAPPDVGLTTFRPPYTPTTFGALAGYRRREHFEAARKTPIDSWAYEHGAVFEPVALWRRARYFPEPGEDMRTAVARECRAVRNSVGIFDATTLGKIEVIGPDAATFLNRMYTNAWTSLEPGRCRYGLLLGEDGFIRDDGVIGRLSPDHFHVTTTTGGAARVLNMMEDYLQTEWPDLQVWLTSVTEQWAVIALQGPSARELLEPFVDGQDVSNDAFPHMSVSRCKVAGFPARLFRVSFTGELGFEINVPARYGRAVWETLCDAGRNFHLCPYGTEAMHVLRAEKGYIIVGQDTDGTVTPDDAGLSWMIGRHKRDFIGKRSLSRPDIAAKGRKQLVGLLTVDPAIVLDEGAQIVADPLQPKPMRMIGHVTSSYWSETLGRSIALGLIENGRDKVGDILCAPMLDKNYALKVTGSVFYDPEMLRPNG